MNNKKILDLTQDEVEFFAYVYDTAYTELRDYYLATANSLNLKKLNKLSEKIDKYISDNIKENNQ